MADKLPRYLEIYARLRRLIEDGRYGVGDRLPSEHELSDMFKASRITIRAALKRLNDDGYIERVAGRGTTVRAAQAVVPSCAFSFTDQVRMSGHEPSAKLIRLARLPIAGIDERNLPFEPNTEIMLIERLRLIDETPALLSRAFIPRVRVLGLSENDFSERGPGQSLLYVLEKTFDLTLDHGTEWIAPAVVTGDDADLLEVEDPSPVVKRTCLVRDFSDAPILYDETFQTGELEISTHRPHAGPDGITPANERDRDSSTAHR
ncbi:MAG: GntR family transcriptional regulator [Pseudomonadota bacterium]